MLLFMEALNEYEMERIKSELKLAQCGMSGVRVASRLLAKNKTGETKYFYGSNIEVARSKVYHAEEVVLIKAISEGFTEPLSVVIASNKKGYRVPMCYSCRSVYSYINPHVEVIVLNEEFKPVLTTTVHDSIVYHYESKGFIS